MPDRPPRSSAQAQERAGVALPVGYGELLEQLKERVRATQFRAVRAANTELLRLYWSIGRDILDRQEHAGWGGKVIDRLAHDLRAAFPDQRGWSRSNLHYMRSFAAAWPREDAFVPQAVGQLPWGHVRLLLDRLDDQPCAPGTPPTPSAAVKVLLRSGCHCAAGRHR